MSVLVANRGEIAVRVVRAAQEAGLPTLRGSEPSDDVATLLQAAGDIGFPLFVKAAGGGSWAVGVRCRSKKSGSDGAGGVGRGAGFGDMDFLRAVVRAASGG